MPKSDPNCRAHHTAHCSRYTCHRKSRTAEHITTLKEHASPTDPNFRTHHDAQCSREHVLPSEPNCRTHPTAQRTRTRTHTQRARVGETAQCPEENPVLLQRPTYLMRSGQLYTTWCQALIGIQEARNNKSRLDTSHPPPPAQASNFRAGQIAWCSAPVGHVPTTAQQQQQHWTAHHATRSSWECKARLCRHTPSSAGMPTTCTRATLPSRDIGRVHDIGGGRPGREHLGRLQAGPLGGRLHAEGGSRPR